MPPEITAFVTQFSIRSLVTAAVVFGVVRWLRSLRRGRLWRDRVGRWLPEPLGILVAYTGGVVLSPSESEMVRVALGLLAGTCGGLMATRTQDQLKALLYAVLRLPRRPE